MDFICLVYPLDSVDNSLSSSLLYSLRTKNKASSNLTKALVISVVAAVVEHRGSLTMRRVTRIVRVVTLAVSAERIVSLPL